MTILRRRIRIGASLACLALLGASCVGGTEDRAPEFRASVVTEPARSGRIERTLSTTGTVRATEAAKIVAEAGGKLELARNPGSTDRLAIGDEVKEGQLIAVIAAGDLATTARVRARVQALAAARAEHARNKALEAQGLLSINQMSEIDMRLANAQADYDSALLQQSKSRHVAPISGVITSILTSPDGEFVAERAAVAEIMRFGDVIVDLDLGAADILAVAPEQLVRVAVPGTEESFDGAVAHVAPAINPTTRTFRVEVRVANPSGRLRPGMFARCDLVLEAREDAVLVPSRSVVLREGTPRVFVVEAQRARERKVELGLITEDLAQVVSGLEAGTPVVVSGQETLDDDVGVIVNVRE